MAPVPSVPIARWRTEECDLTKPILPEETIEDTVRHIRGNSFTVLDFIDVLRVRHAVDWDRLVERFGQFGEKRRYTVTTYLSNRLDVYSQRPDGLLQPFTRYSEARFKDYRKPTAKERERFGSPWIAIFRKRAG